jgi:hypothetical protein
MGQVRDPTFADPGPEVTYILLSGLFPLKLALKNAVIYFKLLASFRS